jgi:hypothetical protein
MLVKTQIKTFGATVTDTWTSDFLSREGSKGGRLLRSGTSRCLQAYVTTLSQSLTFINNVIKNPRKGLVG